MPLTPQVKDLTDVAQQVPSLIEALWVLIQTPSGAIAIAAFFIWFIVNKDFSHLFNLFDRKERKIFDYLDSYVSKPELANKESIAVLQDIRDGHYFKVGTGIYAENMMRAALIRLHNTTSHLITWKRIRYALPFIESDSDGKVTIRQFRFSEKFGFWYNYAAGFLLMLTAAGSLALSFFSQPFQLRTFVPGILGAVVGLLISGFVFSQNRPMHAAKLIRAEINKPKIDDA